MLRKEAQVALPTEGECYTADDGTVSTVLDDHYDPNYSPSEKEIIEYAEWLGMSLPEDEELLWLAKEGLRAPVPREWKPCKTDTGDVYYFNFKTGESLWDHPMDEYFKNKFATEKEKLKTKKADEAKQKKADEERKRREREDEERRRADDERRRKAEADLKKREAEERKKREKAEAEAAAAEQRRKDDDKRRRREQEEEEARRSAKETSLSASTLSAKGIASTPSPAQAATPRLMTEAEKRQQEQTRKEMDDEYRARVRDAEAQFDNDMDEINTLHERERDGLQSKWSLKTRSAVQAAEDEVQDALEEKQRRAEADNKRDIQKLQDEADDLREQIRKAQDSVFQKIAAGEEEIAEEHKRRLDSRMASVESDVEADQRRKRAERADERAARKAKLAAEHSNALAAFNDTAKRLDQTREERVAAHQRELARVKAEAETSLREELERIERAKQGHSAQLVDELQRRTDTEVAAIKQAAQDEVGALEASERAALDELRRVQRAELEGAAGGASLSAEEKAAARREVDAESQQRLEQLRADSERDWQTQREQLLRRRDHDIERARAEAAAADNAESEDPDDVERSLAAARAVRIAQRRDELAAELEAEEAKLRSARAAAVAAREATDAAAARDAFNDFVAKQEAEHARLRADAERAASQLSAASSAKAQEVKAALQRERDAAEAAFAEASRQLRDGSAAAVAEALNALADELAGKEQAMRREIEAEIMSPDASMSQRAAPTPTFIDDDSELLREKLAQQEAEFKEAEARIQQQPFLPVAQNRGSTPQPAAAGAALDPRHPSMDAAAAYVASQERESHERNAVLRSARDEWRGRSASAGGRVATPSNEIVDIIKNLDAKVSSLMHRVPPSPEQQPASQRHKHESPHKHHRHRSREPTHAVKARAKSAADNRGGDGRRPSSRTRDGGGRGHKRRDSDDAHALAARWTRVLEEMTPPRPTNGGRTGE